MRGLKNVNSDSSSCRNSSSGQQFNCDLSCLVRLDRVTCDDRDKATPQYFTYPCLIVEVLSASTESYDRGGKFRMYRKNPVLQDYLLVSSTTIEMDLYHKNDAGEWIIVNYAEGDTVELKSINLSFPIEQVYRGLTLTPDTESTI